jgi:hypothetical protein
MLYEMMTAGSIPYTGMKNAEVRQFVSIACNTFENLHLKRLVNPRRLTEALFTFQR